MNNRLTSILLAIALIGSLFLYFNKPSGHDQEIQRLEKENQKIRHRLDSANQLINLSLQREIALRLRYEALEHSRQEAEHNTDKWRKRYENEKNSRPVPYTDAELDSLLTAWYGR